LIRLYIIIESFVVDKDNYRRDFNNALDPYLDCSGGNPSRKVHLSDGAIKFAATFRDDVKSLNEAFMHFTIANRR